MLRSAPRFLAQQDGVSVEIVNWPGLEAGDMSQVGFSLLIIGQRYCTTGTPTLKKANRSIRIDEKTIFAVLFITVLEPIRVVLRSLQTLGHHHISENKLDLQVRVLENRN